MKSIAIALVILVILFLFMIAVTIGVALGIIAGFNVLSKKGGENDTESDSDEG